MLNNQLIIVSQTSTWTAALEHKFGPIPPVDRKVCPASAAVPAENSSSHHCRHLCQSTFNEYACVTDNISWISKLVYNLQ